MKYPWKFIIVSFLIGLFLGGAGGILTARCLAHRWVRHSPELFLRRLDHRLTLTDEQRAAIAQILNANREKSEAFHDEMRHNTQAAIRQLLTPAQQPHFDAMVARHEAARREREHR